MPNPFRSPLPALAVAALAFACSASAGSSARGAAPLAVTAPSTVLNKEPRPRAIKRSKRKPTLGERAARIARHAVGIPYRWGGTSPSSGFDCSGLVYWAYGRLGVEVPHSSYALAGTGRRVGRRHLRPGDVLVFSGYGHVGLYIGRGLMVHAPQSGRLVEIVRLDLSRIVAARRITRR